MNGKKAVAIPVSKKSQLDLEGGEEFRVKGALLN